MKHLKKILLLALILMLLTSAFGCNLGTKKGEKSVTLILDISISEQQVAGYNDGIKVITATSEKLYLYDLLLELKEQNKLDFGGTSSTSGFFIDTVDGIAQASDYSTCFLIYTTLLDFSSTQYGVYEFENKTIASSIVGLELLPIIDGETYAIVLTAFEF